VAGLSLLSLAFFYQWPESRFVYSGAALLYLSIMPQLLSKIGKRVNNAQSSSLKSRLNLTLFTIIILVYSTVGPLNPWQPRLDQLGLGRTWTISVVNETLFKTASPYVDVIRVVKTSCEQNDSLQTRIKLVEDFKLSPYETSQLQLFATHCPKI
jgi:hypothetical protein